METQYLSSAEPELLDYDRCSDWRDIAVLDALRAQSEDGNSEDAILSAVRRNRVGGATAMAPIDGERFHQFLEEECGGSRSLIAGDHICKMALSQGFRTYVAWYEVEWRGRIVEAVIAPEWGDAAQVVVIGDDPAHVRRFVEAACAYAERPAGRCLQYSDEWASSTSMDGEIGKVTWDDIVFPESLMKAVREAVEGFYGARDAFEALGFPWRRGILLIGPPGTGKTMVCKAAAAALPDLPFLYVRDLKERRQSDSIRDVFERARKLSPCILAFEDLDGFVKESNRSVFLNELDGFRNNEGILIIASSNHPERVDEALLKRPSRFDRVFHVCLPKLPERQEICRRILARPQLRERFCPDFDDRALTEQAARLSNGMTPAYLKEAFLSAALSLAQRGITGLDDRYTEETLAQLAGLKQHVRKVKDPAAAGEIDTSDEPVGFRRWEP